MSDTKSTLSKARTYAELADYWDTHDLAEIWDQTEPVDIDVDIREEVTLYPLGEPLAAGLNARAREQGVTPTELLSDWVRDKLKEKGR